MNYDISLSKIGVYVSWYGCCQCQQEHYDAQADGLFEAHRWCQSKHGIHEMPIEQYVKMVELAEKVKPA